MATLQGLGPVNYYDSMVPDFRGEALQETQNRLGHAQLQGLNMQNQQAQQQAQQQQQFQQDWQQAYASGDPKALEAIVAKYPGQMETVQKGMGFRDDNHRMQLGNAARDLRLAMASKQPGAVGQAAQTHAGTLASIGSSPEGLLQMLQDDPQGLARTVDLVGMSALGVKDYYDTEHKRDQLAETQRSNRAGESLQSRGQDIQIRGQNISAQLRQAELQDKTLDRQIARETNQARLEDLTQKREINQIKLDEAKEKVRTASIDDYKRVETISDGYQRMADAAKRLKDSKNLSDATGFNSLIWTRPGSDAANIEAEIESLKSQVGMQTLSAMKDLSANGASGLGNASNLEYKGLQSSLSSLDIKQSPKQFEKSLERIMEHAEKGRARLNSTFSKTYPDYSSQIQEQNQSQQSGYSSLWGD